MDPRSPLPVKYVCGGCGAEGTFKEGQVLQCRLCDYRIFFKKRTRRIIEHVAR